MTSGGFLLRLYIIFGSLWCAWYVSGPEWGDHVLSALLTSQAAIVSRKPNPIRTYAAERDRTA